MSTPIVATRWGIIGTGGIARVFAQCVTTTSSGTISQICSRNAKSAEALCVDFGGSPSTVVDHTIRSCDAIYIATPHTAHRDVAVAALHAGTPVLCEKPMTCSEADTRTVVDAARTSGTPLIEAWMYRCHPQIGLAVSLLRTNAIGAVQHIATTFGFEANVDAMHRLRNPDLGGGAILDIGGYPMSISMLFAGDTHVHASPSTLQATGTLDSTGVDADTTATVTFDGGTTATLRASITTDLGMHVEVRGTDGALCLESPFLPESKREGLRATVVLSVDGHCVKQHIHAPVDCFSLEARAMRALIASGNIEPPFPMVGHDESIAIAAALDRWRAALTEPDS